MANIPLILEFIYLEYVFSVFEITFSFNALYRLVIAYTNNY